MNIAIFASGNGSNFQALVKAIRRQSLKANPKLLITDKEKSFVRTRAKKLGIKDIFVNPRNFKSKVSFDKKVVSLLRKEKINLIFLAGYMRILTPYFVKSFKNRIVNIHPALLPAFKGEHAIKDAFNYGSKVTGVTIHFVDEKVDHGPIILQEAIIIKKGMSLSVLERKIHKLEHKLYPLALKLIINKKLKIKGRNVKVS